MPPFIPKKRLASTPPPSAKPTPVKKQRLADVLDAEARNIPGLKKTETLNLGSDDSESSLSDVDSDQFEDVAPAVKQTANTQQESDDEGEFEDVELHKHGHAENEKQPRPARLPGETLQLKFDAPDGIDYTTFSTEGKKKGPTRQEKEIRAQTHKLHVRYLLWHNAIRNAWICDKEVQKTLVAQLPSQIKKEVDKWKRACGISDQEQHSKSTAKKGKKARKDGHFNTREERAWGRPSQRLEAGKADMSRGDPLIPLLKILAAYWKKRFAITAPGLRKRGYGSKLILKKDVESFRKDEHDHERHGERIRNIKEYREIAKQCEGSRDLGAQLFTSLLRGLGIESRLVASLQPAGWGFTKLEEMAPRKLQSTQTKQVYSDSESDSKEPTRKRKTKAQKQVSSPAKTKRHGRKSKGNQDSPIDLESEEAAADAESDDNSVVDITPSLPKRRAPKYDRDLLFPVYWAEAISPITNQVIPVDPLVLEKPVATTPELLMTFEPRGAKAENARLVIAYVVAYSDDGTAKDVTVRYLRKLMWPGKTKPFRYPVERIPVYDRTGRVKRYEDLDWFKQIMSGYVRTDTMRSAVDDIEDSTDLVPQVPEKKAIDTSVDTLQSLKSSADFVLERFLRREEALRPGAKPDRVFISGKGDALKSESVYRRADVERCLTAESWHKEGRHPKPDEKPLKMVPVRAVTLTRKREAEEHERITGEKQMQGLYSWDQTDYIIPPPIEDGVIPKNSYGNIDCFVPSMVPKGAVHIPFRGTVRICKRLEIDFAEAVVGFEFGNKRAVPVINGVVIAKENESDVKKAWKEWNEEQQRKEAVKKEKLVLDLWRKFIVGMRIRERVGEMYGQDMDNGSEANALSKHPKKSGNSDEPIDVDGDDGSVRAGPSGTASAQPEDENMMGGGFLVSEDEDEAEPEDLVIEHHTVPTEPAAVPVSRKGKEKAIDSSAAAAQYPTPASMSSAKMAESGKSQQRTRQIITEAEDEAESESELSELSLPSDPATDDLRSQIHTKGALLSADSTTGESADLLTETSSTEADTDESDEVYLPQSSARRRGRTSTSTHKPKTSDKGTAPSRSTRSRRSIADVADADADADVDSDNTDADGTSGDHGTDTDDISAFGPKAKLPQTQKQTQKQTEKQKQKKKPVVIINAAPRTHNHLSTPKSPPTSRPHTATPVTGTRSPYFQPSDSPRSSRQRGKRKPGF